MADTRPTPISFWRAIALCVRLLVAPGTIAEEERKDAELKKKLGPPPEPEHRAYIVRRAFLNSLGLVLASAIIGFAAGEVMTNLGRCALPSTVAWLQAVGSCMLLWGTLFVRGWAIQSLGGVLLVERINQWIYRFLYCLGTALLVFSVAFPACKQ